MPTHAAEYAGDLVDATLGTRQAAVTAVNGFDDDVTA
jgi:hypothetical protein